MQIGPSQGPTTVNVPVTRSKTCKLPRHKTQQIPIGPSQGPTSLNSPVTRPHKFKSARHKVQQMQTGPSQGPKNEKVHVCVFKFVCVIIIEFTFCSLSLTPNM